MDIKISPTFYEIININEYCKSTSYTTYTLNEKAQKELWLNLNIEINEYRKLPKNSVNILAIESLLFEKFYKNNGIKLPSNFSESSKSTCGEIAFFYGNIYSLLGYSVKNVQLQQSLFSKYTTHVIIDVWDNEVKQWICIDPTYNFYFEDKKKKLSSIDIYARSNQNINLFIKPINSKFNSEKKINHYPSNYRSFWNVISYDKFVGEMQSKVLLFFNKFLVNKHYLINEDDNGYKVKNCLITILYLIPLFSIISLLFRQRLNID